MAPSVAELSTSSHLQLGEVHMHILKGHKYSGSRWLFASLKMRPQFLAPPLAFWLFNLAWGSWIICFHCNEILINWNKLFTLSVFV